MPKPATPREPLKDQLFNREKVSAIAAEIRSAHDEFDAEAFTEAVVARLPELELKQRISWIATCLRERLPADFTEALRVLVSALPEQADPTLGDGDFGDFIYAPYGEFVAAYGCSGEHLDRSLEALRQITTRFSAEYAIRAFLNQFPDETYAALEQWSRDEHYHVRRLCSEGTRPRLPWGHGLTSGPLRALGLLDELHADPTRFVTRSVANHVNDLSKSDPDLVLQTLKRWQVEQRQEPRELAFVVRHATRTLVKAGHPGAMELVGIAPGQTIELIDVDVPSSVALGESLDFRVQIRSPHDAEAIVDYAMHSPRADGGMSRRVFKLGRTMLPAGETVALTKSQLLRQNMTTRTIRPGTHGLEVIVNGLSHPVRDFDVTE
ncbi:DNA alkylation repair protein [Microbacterium halotolerans]|uniref:DNA alkylation repair protein n=1 Tax=Microbacterium halotolerans TaxID=246613 RepID=UPI000E6AB2DA|nr:DNA alkylation repair protein [Microbacterium halotolerans]